MKNRFLELDITKLIAIFLVVLGHSIQCISSCGYDESEMFRFIYSFHMPLFAFISGYFHPERHDSLRDHLIKRTRQLLLPVFSWSIIYLLLIIIIENPPHLMGIVKPCFYYQFWFLKCIWVCDILTFVILYYIRNLKKRLLALGVLSIILCMIPDVGGMFWINFLFPIYMVAVVIKKILPPPIQLQRMLQVFDVKLFTVTLISIGVFVTLYDKWDLDYLIYSCPIDFVEEGIINIDNITIASLRFILGLCASFVIFCMSFMFIPKISLKYQEMLAKVGQRTLGIYIIQTFVFFYIERYTECRIIYDGITLFFISVVILLISYYMVILIEKSQFASLWLLGLKRNK